MSAGEGRAALVELGRELIAEQTPISPCVVDPPTDGEHFGSGPHAGVVETVREGYLLHYSTARLLEGQDEDLALLAGDYLYALGIRRLAASGDSEAVLRLANLISDCAAAHAEGRQAEPQTLWKVAAAALAAPSQ